jgi:uncharacterized membrane protein
MSFFWHSVFTDHTVKPHYSFIFLLLLAACRLPEEKQLEAMESDPDTTVMKTSNSYSAAADTLTRQPIPRPRPVKKPTGIYQTTLPFDEGVTIEQTVAFQPDNNFVLQEKYRGNNKDSVVVTEGSWSPSDGFIWLYSKDQVVRGRYVWKDNILHWVSPPQHKNFPMHQLKDVLENSAWQNKPSQGVVLFGTGTEPFWTVSLTRTDSLSFLLADWEKPLTLRLDSSSTKEGYTAYTAGNDSLKLKLTVYPQFCTDGMSDFVYRNRIRLQYNSQVYNGCGIVYK